MSSQAKARAAALRRQFEEEMRQVEVLEQEEKRRRVEERTKAAEERAKAMEMEEVENTVDPGAGPHIETKKWKRAGSGFTILGTLTTANGGSWRAEDRWVCNPCRRLNRSCIWRQDNKKVRTCYFCQQGKFSCTLGLANAEVGPSKKLRVSKGKERAVRGLPFLFSISRIPRSGFY